MFILNEFIKSNLINGVANNSFTREYANITAVNYLTKGLLGNEDLQEIDEATAPKTEEVVEVMELEAQIPEIE